MGIITIQESVKQYLKAVEATKGAGIHSSYEACLGWAEQHITSISSIAMISLAYPLRATKRN